MTAEKKETVSPDVSVPTVPALAYLGDAVMEVLIRERLVRLGLCASARLNEAALDYVRAAAQSAASERLMPYLTEEEEAVWRRGRNAGHGKNTPKSATVTEYRRATGLEALFGQLWLDKKTERLSELLDVAYPELSNKE